MKKEMLEKFGPISKENANKAFAFLVEGTLQLGKIELAYAIVKTERVAVAEDAYNCLADEEKKEWTKYCHEGIRLCKEIGEENLIKKIRLESELKFGILPEALKKRLEEAGRRALTIQNNKIEKEESNEMVT